MTNEVLLLLTCALAAAHGFYLEPPTDLTTNYSVIPLHSTTAPFSATERSESQKGFCAAVCINVYKDQEAEYVANYCRENCGISLRPVYSSVSRNTMDMEKTINCEEKCEEKRGCKTLTRTCTQTCTVAE